MKTARNTMSTTLITLGVIVALLAILLTPGFLDISSALIPSVGEVPEEQSFTIHSSLQEISSQSIETVASFLSKVSTLQ